jgi:hypothetical protein
VEPVLEHSTHTDESVPSMKSFVKSATVPKIQRSSLLSLLYQFRDAEAYPHLHIRQATSSRFDARNCVAKTPR